MARRTVVAVAVLAAASAVLLVAQAFLLASVLASIVDGKPVGPRSLGALAGVLAGRALVAWGSRVVAARGAAGAKEELRARAVDHALALGPEWISARGTGELSALTTRGLDALDAYFTEYVPALVTACVVPLVAGAAVLYADWPSALILALTVPLLPVFGALVGMHTADRVQASMGGQQRLSGHLLELIRALPVLVAFRRADAQAEAVRRVSDRHRRAAIGTLRTAFSSAFVLELIATLSVALVAVTIGVRLVSGDLALAIGLGVLLLVPECYQPLRAVGAAFHASEDGVEAVRRVAEVLGEHAPAAAGGARLPAGRELRVEGLRVRRRGEFAPDGESFVARPGTVTWLRSSSGAGKTTTLSVLLGFVRPASGGVSVGGRPLDELDPVAWRRELAWVPQFPVLPGETVRAVLASAGADLDRPPSEPEIQSVTGSLGIADLLEREPGELSIGERQRVAVARALLRLRLGAWLLLLDEPTAHLDEPNAARVLGEVRAAADRGAAVVLAAHRAAGAEDPADHAVDVSTSGPVRSELVSTTGGRLLSLRELVDKRIFAGVVLGALALLAGVALAATSGWLIAKASQQPPMLTLTVAIVGVRTFGLGRAVLRYLERLVTHDAALRGATRLRVRLWRALVRLGPARSSGYGSAGEHQRNLVDDIDTVRDLVPRVLTPPMVVAVVVSCAVGAQALVLPSAGGVLAGAVLVGGLGAAFAQFHVEQRATAALAERRRGVQTRVLMLFEAAAELLAYGSAHERRAELAASDRALVRLARRIALGEGVAGALITAACGAAALACTWLALDAVRAGALDPVLAPVLALVPLALAEVLALVPPVAVHAEALRGARARLGALLEGAQAAAVDPGGAVHPGGVVHSGETVHSGTAVQLHHATVRWPGARTPALFDVELDVPAGAHIAVLGPSGSGKSTLLAAVLGFLPPEHGTVQVSAEVIWAPQDPQLVSTTLAENLRLGDPHATDAQLADVLRAVHLGAFAERLHTVLGSAGAGLSGGQARRLSLARALLAVRRAERPAVVLLDEPTAHLDAATARGVLANLRAELAGHTVLHVTHHVEDTEGADLVLEVRAGRVHQLTAA